MPEDEDGTHYLCYVTFASRSYRKLDLKFNILHIPFGRVNPIGVGWSNYNGLVTEDRSKLLLCLCIDGALRELGLGFVRREHESSRKGLYESETAHGNEG